jgi:hypothetical protein
MLHTIRRLTCLLLLTAAAAAAGDMVIVEEAVESQPIDLQLTSGSSGLVYANDCDGCKPMQLVVTQTTQAWFAGKQLTLHEVQQYAQLGGTIFYDKETRIVTRIVVWQ